MKLYIKTNDEGFITESSLVKYDKSEKATIITVNEEQYELIRQQYDTKVVDSEIVSQTKWENALILEKEEEKAQIERDRQKQEESKPTE